MKFRFFLTGVLASIAMQSAMSETRADHSLDKKIGQMIMVGFDGTSERYDGVKAIMQQLKDGSIGGVMLLHHNIVSHRQLRLLTTALHGAAKSGGQLPPLIAVDQEGGAVQRLKFTPYPSAKHLADNTPLQASKVYDELACELRTVGVNVNFGPVADLDLRGSANPVIGRMARSYGKSPATVTDFARQFVLAHKRHGILTVAKHFPGHGSSFNDSHKGFTAIPEWNQLGDELAPFVALASGSPDETVDMMMIGHLYNKAWGAPASLSNKAVSGILRDKVKFSGIAITDDMEMGAIRKNYQWKTAIIRAVNAGNDILLYANTISHSRNLGRKIGQTIKAALCESSDNQNCIDMQSIDKSYQRIRLLKNRRITAPATCR